MEGGIITGNLENLLTNLVNRFFSEYEKNGFIDLSSNSDEKVQRVIDHFMEALTLSQKLRNLITNKSYPRLDHAFLKRSTGN